MSLTTDALLGQIETQRRIFLPPSENRALDSLVHELVHRGVYPQKSKTGMTALRMVECYGARWHLYDGPQACPHCQADLRDLEHGPPFKRELGLIENDRCTKFVCPDCGKAIGRTEERGG